jgi:hypothetical protein
MTVKIEKKIKSYSVVSAEGKNKEAAPVVVAASADDNVIQMHERIERPEVLIGSTYKIKSPLVEHAMFEIFINSKSMEHFQWIVALTRIMSAVFRKGGDVTFIVDEMKAVFDPRGGYFKAGGVYMPSLVAELGSIIEDHLKSIGMLHDPEMSDAQRALIAEKRRAYEEQQKKNLEPLVEETQPVREEDVAVTGDGTSFPPSASMCHKCNTKALVIMDGCATCLNCGYSKCG